MSGLVTDSAETLAEVLCSRVLHRGQDHTKHGPCGLSRQYAQAVLASDWMKRHDAEVRAEALRGIRFRVETAATAIRAALAEEGGDHG